MPMPRGGPGSTLAACGPQPRLPALCRPLLPLSLRCLHPSDGPGVPQAPGLPPSRSDSPCVRPCTLQTLPVALPG